MDRLEAIYSHFRSFCARVGIEKPMAEDRWLAIADHVVKERSVPKPPLSTVPKHCGPRNPACDNSRRIKLRKRSTTKVSFPEPEAQR